MNACPATHHGTQCQTAVLRAPPIWPASRCWRWAGPSWLRPDCVDTRKATAAEVDFHSRAAAALMAALPPVPVGGQLQQSDTVPTLGVQCKGVTGDFRLEATRWYELNWRKSIVTVAINVKRLPADRQRSVGRLRLGQSQRQCGAESEQRGVERERLRLSTAPGAGRLDRPHTPAVMAGTAFAFGRRVQGPGGPGRARDGRGGSGGCARRSNPSWARLPGNDATGGSDGPIRTCSLGSSGWPRARQGCGRCDQQGARLVRPLRVR